MGGRRKGRGPEIGASPSRNDESKVIIGIVGSIPSLPARHLSGRGKRGQERVYAQGIEVPTGSFVFTNEGRLYPGVDYLLRERERKVKNSYPIYGK